MRAFLDLGSGLTVGLAGMAAGTLSFVSLIIHAHVGMAIGIVGDSGVRATAQQPRLYIAMVLILIFSEALALYGLIVSILLSGKSDNYCGDTTSSG